MPDSIQGRRVPDGTDPNLLKPGDYSRDADNPQVWNVRPPKMGRYEYSLVGRIVTHSVEEHEDKTISVSPSILQKFGDNEEAWHGFLKRGVWTIA